MVAQPTGRGKASPNERDLVNRRFFTKVRDVVCKIGFDL